MIRARFQKKLLNELKGLLTIMYGWSPEGWLVEDVKKKENYQMIFFKKEL